MKKVKSKKPLQNPIEYRIGEILDELCGIEERITCKFNSMEEKINDVIQTQEDIMAAIDDLKDQVKELQAQEQVVKQFIKDVLQKVKDLQAVIDAGSNVDPAIIEATAAIKQEVDDLKADIAQA